MRSSKNTGWGLVTCLWGIAGCGDSGQNSASEGQGSTQGSDATAASATAELPTTSGATGTGLESSSGSTSGAEGTGDTLPEGRQCGPCPFARPNVLLLLDYSSSMNRVWEGEQSRYQVVVPVLSSFLFEHFALVQRMSLALAHFGHDPKPDSPGTSVAVDQTGMVDGQKLDNGWIEMDEYLVCNGDVVASTLLNIPAPANGLTIGIGTWTRGALEFSRSLIAEQRAALGESVGEAPHYRIVLITNGEWTSPDGSMNLAPASEHPMLAAQALSDAQVKTYVVYLSDAENPGWTAAQQLAAAGGTTAIYDASTPALLPGALEAVFEAIDAENILPPSCPG